MKRTVFSMRGILTRVVGLLLLGFLTGAWHEVGNGGDPLRLMFASAREQASQMTARMHQDAFSQGTHDAVKDWILRNKRELASDILRSEHIWHEGVEATCAHAASIGEKSLVEFSYPTCRNAIKDKMDAIFTLIHEAVHHFGIGGDQESFCDAVALAIISAWKSGILDWQPISARVDLAARSHHTAIWAGDKMIIFGGVTQDNAITNTGYIFDPAANTWTPIKTDGAPARAYHRALWTGTKMIVWGGQEPGASPGAWIASGAIYDPANGGSWETIQSTRIANATIPRLTNQTAIWTGNEMIVWGSAVVSANRTHPEGGIYNLETKQWRAISFGENAPLRYSGHSAVWTGSKMIVWGGKPLPGQNGSNVGETNEGAVYDITNNKWQAMPTTGAPKARHEHTAIWTGNKMIIFGGIENFNRSIKGTGAIFDPSVEGVGAWKNFNSELTLQRSGHTALWNGEEMIIFGGKQQSAAFNIVSAYNPTLDSWRAVSAPSAPPARSAHSGVWTGMSMIIFGGVGEDNSTRLGDGGLFYP